MNTMCIALEADGQALAVTQALPDNDRAPVEALSFTVALSDEWEGFGEYAVLLKRGGLVRSLPVSDGAAFSSLEGMAGADRLEVALMAQGGGRRLTTERGIILLNMAELRAILDG